MAVPTKQYGLILPQKKGLSKTGALLKHSVFADDSDEDTSVGQSLQREAVKKKTMKQTRLEMQKALEEDSSVYDYDAVYDEIQKQRLEANKKVLGGTDKRPKYIHQLLKAVEDRKKEQERRDERKIQKEREAEGDQFADKDAYVTSAYRQKLQEQKEEEEREKREAAMEAALDVRKQKDLSGFYRHLLNQTVGEEAIPDRSAKDSQMSKVSKDTEKSLHDLSPTSHDQIPKSGSDSEEGHEQKPGFSKPSSGSTHSKRQYRQRSPSSGSGEDDDREKDRDKQRRGHKDRTRERDRDRERHREREDRHGRRDDRDRRKDKERDRERGREDDKHRRRGNTERDDRHGKRERSPKERERDRNEERDRRKNPNKDREDKERGVDEKDPEKKEDIGEQSKEGEEEKKEEKVDKFAKRCTDETVTSARERYLARQMARTASKAYIEPEED